MTQTTAMPRITEVTRSAAAPAASRTAPGRARRRLASRRTTRAGQRTLWPLWLLLVALTFIALESILLALAMQGRWIILLAPGAVCASKAWETWKELKRKAISGQRSAVSPEFRS